MRLTATFFHLLITCKVHHIRDGSPGTENGARGSVPLHADGLVEVSVKYASGKRQDRSWQMQYQCGQARQDALCQMNHSVPSRRLQVIMTVGPIS